MPWRGLVRRQHGTVAAWQLRTHYGWTKKQIRTRLHSGEFVAVHLGVYAVGHGRLTWRGHACAAVLAGGSDAALSHRSAAMLQDRMPVTNRPFDITVPGRRAVAGLNVHRSTSLGAEQVCLVDGIQVTILFRTLLDVAAVLSRGELADVVDEARYRGLDADTAANYVEANRRGRRGTRELLLLLSDEAALRNEFERRFRDDVLSRVRLPTPLTNTHQVVEGRRHELDVYWPEVRLNVELDGFKHHGRRDRFEHDRDRDSAFLVADIATMRMTWRQVTDTPAKMARRVAEVYAARVRRFANEARSTG